MRVVLVASLLVLASPRPAGAQACITCWQAACHELEGVVPACAPAKRKAPLSPEGRAREVVTQVVKRHLNEIRYCYERALTRDPTLHGTLVVHFEIATDGTAAKARTTKDTFPATTDVAACVTTRIPRWVFPEKLAKGVLAVSYPFVFEPPKR